MTRSFLPLVGGLFLFSACVDTGVTSFNASPVIVILSHLDGDQVRAGELVVFRAGASDPDNGPDTLVARWFVDDSEVCPAANAEDDGITTCEVVLRESDTEVTVEIRDPANAASSARVILDVLPTQAPQAYIVSPEVGVAWYSDTLIPFRGLLLDWEDLPAELTAWWELDGVGDLGLAATPDDQGSTIDFAVLPEGEHAILLHVTDTEGRTAFDQVIITVGAPNSPPGCQISAPGDGSSGELGVEVVFEGLASDADVAPDQLTATWTSDQDGYMGQSLPDSAGALSLATSDLSAGTHAVTLAVSDDAGATCADVVLFSVGGPPTVSLEVPLVGDAYSDAEAILFQATVSDAEDRPQDLLLSWVSSLDGELDTAPADSSGAAVFVQAGLAVGTHDVTLTVLDSDGLYALAVTTFTIDGLPSQPVVALAPDPATTADDLVASITTDSVDPDGNPITYAWSWTVDGVASSASTTETLAAGDTARGETWRVAATPNDGTLDGAAGEAEVVVGNTAPEVASAALTPDPADEGDVLTCAPGATSDADGDGVSAGVTWSVDGVTLTGLGSALDGTYFERDDTVFCTVTPDDGTDSGVPVDSNSVVIGNSAPSVTSVAITPDPTVAGDVLSCATVGYSDLDGDPEATTYSWLLNGVSDGSGSTYAGAFLRGDVVTCTATPSDGTASGAAVSTSVTVDNTAPSVASAAITPDPAAPSDTLSCAWTGFSDADGDSDASTVDWSIAGTSVGSGTTLAGVFAKGDSVTCTVTPSDGLDAGVAVAAVVSVGNTAPVISGVSISPATPGTDDVLTASASATDADGDAVALAYDWTVDGSYVASGSTLDGTLHFDRDQVVAVEVTPNDGSEDGTTTASAGVTVANTAPSVGTVSITPSAPEAGDALSCSHSGFVDADGDSDLSSVAWTLAGSSVGSGTTYPGTPAAGDVIACVVTPDDGTDPGTDVTATVTVDNSAPSITSVTISPDPAIGSDTLACAYAGFSDPDGDPDASTLAWTVGGTTVGTGASLSTGYARGDLVTCTVTPSDGTDSGTALSDSLTIANTAPLVSAVSLSPSAPGTDDALVASASASDADGDSVSLSYDWYVDGSYVTSGSSSLDGGTWFDRGQSVTVEVTPTDGADAGTAASSSAVTVVNTAPALSSVSVSPDPPSPGDTLVCTASGYTDADGDADASTFDWDVGGSSVGSAATLSGAFADGDLVTCTVTPDDGTDSGTAVSASVLVGNAAPSIGSVSISPDPATGSDTLTCTYSGYSDPEGDADASTLAWDVGGSGVGSGSTLSTGFGRDDTVTCTVTPSDGSASGSPVSDSLVIDNTAPVVSAVAITPTTALTDDTLTASASATDADGDAITLSYDWSVDGTYVSTGGTLSGSSAFDKGQGVEVTATPSDGTDTGTALTSSSLTVQNSPPGLTSATVLPASPEPTDVLTCSANGYVDADGDASASTWAWDIGGTTVGTGSSYSGTLADGDVVTCTITPSDGTDSGTAVTDTVTVAGSGNTAPSITAVSISPASPQTDDVLTASASTSDGDGDTVTVAYDWSVDGTYVWTGTTLDGASFFDRDQVIDVVATPHDGTDFGAAVSASSVTVINTAPSLASASISPASPTTADTLTCSGNGYSDDDGDTDVTSFSWDIGGTTVGTGATYSGALSDGDVVTCTATPDDGTDTGTAVTASATVGSSNTPPTITSVSISPSSPLTDDLLAAASSTFDADGDAVSVTYDWSVDGTYVASGSTLDGATWFDRGQDVDLVATPNDGTDDGSAVSHSTVTVGNSPPQILAASITPSSPTATDTLACAATGYSDPDADADASTYAWAVNGSTVASGTTHSGGLLDGDLVTCTITPSDGTDSGSAVSATVTIGTSANSAPSITSVVISPSTASDGDTLTCTYSGFSDADGDPDASFLQWTVSGSAAGSSSTLSGAFGRDDSVVCQVTPFDGTDTGTALSDSLIVSNTAPAVSAVSLSPSSPGTDDVLTASASTSDADGDSVSVVYDWYVDGSFVASGTSTLDGGTYFDRGQTVYVEATPDDSSDFGTAVSSSVVTVDNSVPAIASVTVSPDPATPSDTLLCSYSGYSDADGDADASTLAWDVGGASAGTGTSLSGAFSDGDAVTCTVTPDDGTDTGTALSDSVAISASPNTAPVVTAVTISPASPDTDTVLTASASTTDADGDTVTLTYDWSVDGGYVYTGSTLDGGTFFDRDQGVDVTAIPHDGTDFGTGLAASSVTVLNSAPTTPGIAISPSSPEEGADDLICAVDTASTDADSDGITYTFAWSVDGVDYPAGDTADTATWAGPNSTIYTDDTVPGSDTLDGETWVCTVFADDGTDSSSSAATFVTVSAGAADDYSGTWTLDTPISYSCAFGFVNLSFSSVIITDSNPTIVVAETSSQPGTMTGTFSTSVDWTAQNVLAGSCTETYTMTGAFSDTNTFTALFEADFTPAAGCLGCSYQSWSVTGTR